MGRNAPWLIGLAIASGCGGGLSHYVKSTAPGNPDGSAPVESSTPSSSTSTTLPDTPADTGTTASTTSGLSTSTSTTSTEPWVDGDPLDPPPYTTPPPELLPVDCASVGLDADLDDNEVDVLSHDNDPEIRTLTSPVRGWYELYDRAMSHQGDGEWNESAMVRILNAAAPDGSPVLDNCEGDWVAVDPDNYTDPGTALVYLGTFWFEIGDNTLVLEHLCPRVRAGSCTALEFLDDPGTTCGSGDGNSAHLDGEHLCLVAIGALP